MDREASGDPVGLYLATTSGELWLSRNERGKWAGIARHLPETVAVKVAAGTEDALL